MSVNSHKDDEILQALIQFTHKLTGITIRPKRKAMLEGRLRRRVRELSLEDLGAYLHYAKTHPEEQEFFINALTTNETYFYRTPRIWEYISDSFIDEWTDAGQGNMLKAWSAASSTGEEAHTLGIVLEHFRSTHPGFDYRVRGTDIDTSVIAKASDGLYNGRALQRFREAREDLFSQYMIGDDDNGYQALPSIRQRISFKLFNLFEQADEVRFDLILIRNVLIYFTQEDQHTVMSRVHRRLNPEGVVIIGESESLNNVCDGFNLIAPTIYRRSDACSAQQAA